MARLRYVKTLEQVRKAAEGNPEFLESSVRSIRVVYETDPALAAAVLPEPFKPAERPEVCVTFSHVAMKISPQFTFEIGSAIFGVRAYCQGAQGVYLITMPMTAEQAVVSGRETFGEPKKIAAIDFARDGDVVAAKVSRMGISYLEANGRIGKSLGPRAFTEHAFCIKAFPSCRKGQSFDSDPLIVRLDWKHDQKEVHAIDAGKLILRESPYDPVADLPVRRLVRMEYEQGTTESNGTVLGPIAPASVLPFLHQRYDEPGNPGIEI
jgi:acetoacetate decarboxylase